MALRGCGKAFRAAACMLHIAASVASSELHKNLYDAPDACMCGSVQVPGAQHLLRSILRDAAPCSAAHAMLWNDDYLHQIEGDFGDKTAHLVAQSHQTAIDTLEQVCPEELASHALSSSEAALVHDAALDGTLIIVLSLHLPGKVIDRGVK